MSNKKSKSPSFYAEYQDLKKFINSQKHLVAASCAPKLEPLKNEEMVLYIAEHGKENFSLSSIAERFLPNMSLNHEFAKTIFKIREKLSLRDRMILSASRNFSESAWEKARMEVEPLTEEEKSRLLELPDFSTPRTIGLSAGLKHAIDIDSPAAFMMHMQMNDKKISKSLLTVLFRKNAANILGALLKDNLIPPAVGSRDGIIAYIVSKLHSINAVKLLKGIDSALPGYLRDFRDAFGRNLLWYAVRNNLFRFNMLKNWMREYLQLEVNCAPGNKNILGVSFLYMQDCIPFLQTAKRLNGQACCRRNTVEKKDLLPILEQWADCRMPTEEFGAVKGKNISRSRVKNPLRPEIREELRGKLQEVFWNYTFMPEKSLPVSWQVSVTPARRRISRELQKIAQTAMKNCFPGETVGKWHPAECKLEHIPVGGEKGKLTSPQKKKEAAISIMSSGLLMYNPLVVKYLQQHLLPRKIRTLNFIYAAPAEKIFVPELATTVENDDAEAFAGLAKACPPEVLDAVVRGRKKKIITYLLDERENFYWEYPVNELVLYAASRLDDKSGSEFLQMLRSRWKRYNVKYAEDCFGSNALWHTIFNPYINCFDPECKLVRELEKSGCSPMDLNDFGLSFSDVRDVVSREDIELRKQYLECCRAGRVSNNFMYQEKKKIDFNFEEFDPNV